MSVYEILMLFVQFGRWMYDVLKDTRNKAKK